MSTTIERNAWTNDSGTYLAPAGDGTLLTNESLQEIYDRIDRMFSGADYTGDGGNDFSVFEFGGRIDVAGFGGHTFVASGTGPNYIMIANPAAGTTNIAELRLGNDGQLDAGLLSVTSSAFTAIAPMPQDGLALVGQRGGGLSIATTYAEATIRFYTGGAFERVRIDALGNVGIGIQPGRQLHVYGQGQTSASLSDAGVTGGTLYVQDSQGGNGNGGAVLFGASQGQFACVKGLLTNGADNSIGDLAFGLRRVSTDAAFVEIMRLSGTGAVYINEFQNAGMTAGLTINQGSNNDEILAFKSATVVNHSMLEVAEGDTYATFKKQNATLGGLQIRGLCEAGAPHCAIELGGYSSSSDSTRSTSAYGAIVLDAALYNGATGIADHPADANLLVIRNHSQTRFIFDSDGDSWEDGVGWTAFDDHDDVQVIEAVEYQLTRTGLNPIDRAFSQLMEDERGILAALGLVTFNENGRHFVNRSRMQSLLCGAVRQLARRVATVHTRIEALEARCDRDDPDHG